MKGNQEMKQEIKNGAQVYEMSSGKWSLRYVHVDGRTINHDWLVADDWRRAIWLANCNDIGVSWIAFADGRTVAA